MYAGWAADWGLTPIKKKTPKIGDREIHSRRPHYVIRLLKAQTRPSLYADGSGGRKVISAEEWNGRNVYCVELPKNHTLYVRRNGKAVWCGNTRTYHRMVCGIEEAGFQIRDKIDEFCELDGYLAWVHGQGFPKSFNIGKRATTEAKLWEGYGTALKPAHEPIADFGKDAGPLNPEVPFWYEAKASGKERNRGCENLFWLTDDNGKTIGILKEDYDRMVSENEARKSEAGYEKHRVTHGNIWPCVKPLDLMRYLVRMVKMPENNLILDPFMGSGTTIVACILEGCDYIGIDSDEIAIKIAKARIDYALAQGE